MPPRFKDDFWEFITPAGFPHLEAALRALYLEQNLSLAAVGRILGVSPRPLTRKLRELGIPIKKHGGYRHGQPREHRC